MTLPPDIARLKFTWRRRRSDAWTETALRGRVIAFLNEFLALHSWVDRWEVTERFASNNVNVRVPRTEPVQPAEDEDFKQRDGMRLLIINVRRMRDQKMFEVGMGFPKGNNVTDAKLDKQLSLVRATLEAEEQKG